MIRFFAKEAQNDRNSRLERRKPTYGKQFNSERFFVGQVPLMNLTKEVY